jgi:CubicO group peptidase (beta-lactamase class C family)
MAALDVPGVSLAVIDSGRVVWARGFGVKAQGTGDSVTAATLFQAQSISKPVAATAMLRLVEAGTLSLDRNVNTYLKSWKLPENRFTAHEHVTLRRIVSHSAGITVGGFPGYTLFDSIPTLVQVLNGEQPANTPPVRVDTFPGAIWRYSGGGLLVMQQLLIDVTGEPFPVLMKRLVLEPIGMTRSTYEQPLPVARRGEAASGHDSDGSVIKGQWPVHPEMAAGGLWTTPTELARWALAISDAWAGRSTTLVSRKMAREMLTVQKAPVGLGPFLEGSDSTLRFGHSGSNRGFRAEFVMFPTIGRGAVVMTNADRGAGLIDEVFQSVAAEYQWPAYGQTERITVTLAPTQLDGLVGQYAPRQDAAGTPVVVEVTGEGGRLFLEVLRLAPKHELFPASADSFFTLAGSNVVFTRDESGRATKVNLGGQVEARRVP